jgi:hypothetical protein
MLTTQLKPIPKAKFASHNPPDSMTCNRVQSIAIPPALPIGAEKLVATPLCFRCEELRLRGERYRAGAVNKTPKRALEKALADT